MQPPEAPPEAHDALRGAPAGPRSPRSTAKNKPPAKHRQGTPPPGAPPEAATPVRSSACDSALHQHSPPSLHPSPSDWTLFADLPLPRSSARVPCRTGPSTPIKAERASDSESFQHVYPDVLGSLVSRCWGVRRFGVLAGSLSNPLSFFLGALVGPRGAPPREGTCTCPRSRPRG